MLLLKLEFSLASVVLRLHCVPNWELDVKQGGRPEMSQAQ